MVRYFRTAAAAAADATMLVYIQQQLDYAKLWKLLDFSQARRPRGQSQTGNQDHIQNFTSKIQKQK